MMEREHAQQIRSKDQGEKEEEEGSQKQERQGQVGEEPTKGRGLRLSLHL